MAESRSLLEAPESFAAAVEDGFVFVEGSSVVRVSADKKIKKVIKKKASNATSL